MDTRLGVKAMPARADSDEIWRDWANAYPTVTAIHLACTELVADSGTFVLDDAPFPPNPNGAVNGGMVALAADQVMGVLAARVAPEGCLPVTAVLSTQFHLPAMPPLTFRGIAVPGGRSVQTIEVIVTSADGRRCATATGTMAVGSAGGRAKAED